MGRHWSRVLIFMSCALLAAPAVAQQAGVRWQQDLEAAKGLARQTGRLVLVHVWTPECAPCLSLEQNVFSQPGIGSALETQFVPVKLNANENRATAEGLGITRVPTDVILTADGHVIGRLISPPTPAAYLAEVTQVAREYSARPGQTYGQTVAAAPVPPQLNSAYANLRLAPNTQPAIASQAQTPAEPSAATPVTTSNQFAQQGNAQQPSAQQPGASFSPPPVTPAPVQQVNPYIAVSQQQSLQPSGAQAAAPPAAASAAATSPAPAGAPDPKLVPAGAPPLGFDGYCPVSMRNHWKWVAGNPQFGIVHRGRTYWFAGPNEQQQFWTDPDRYSPALSGMDPVMSIDHGQQVPGKREHSIDYDNLFYMFASEATLQQFTANPERYAIGVRQAMGIQRGRLVR